MTYHLSHHCSYYSCPSPALLGSVRVGALRRKNPPNCALHCGADKINWNQERASHQDALPPSQPHCTRASNTQPTPPAPGAVYTGSSFHSHTTDTQVRRPQQIQQKQRSWNYSVSLTMTFNCYYSCNLSLIPPHPI
jgi:hypothetical protein